MTRVNAHNLFGDDKAFWDIVYSAVAMSLGIAATAAICIQISGL